MNNEYKLEKVKLKNKIDNLIKYYFSQYFQYMSNDIFRKYIQYTTSYYICLTFVIEVFV